MEFGGIALNMEINIDLHHLHTISSHSYQPFSLFVEGARPYQKKKKNEPMPKRVEPVEGGDKVCSTKMMTNNDNVESSLLTSILLNICNLYK